MNNGEVPPSFIAKGTKMVSCYDGRYWRVASEGDVPEGETVEDVDLAKWTGIEIPKALIARYPRKEPG